MIYIPILSREITTSPDLKMLELFIKFNAHKDVEYGKAYYTLLKQYSKKPMKLLEIGYGRGGSIKAYHEFLPLAELFSIEFLDIVDTPDWLTVCKANQLDAYAIKNFALEHGKFDVIIDDGGHHSSEQQVSYETLFDFVVDGGIYIIEDLHCACYLDHQDRNIDSRTYFNAVKNRKKFFNGHRKPDDICVIYKEKENDTTV